MVIYGFRFKHFSRLFETKLKTKHIYSRSTYTPSDPRAAGSQGHCLRRCETMPKKPVQLFSSRNWKRRDREHSSCVDTVNTAAKCAVVRGWEGGWQTHGQMDINKSSALPQLLPELWWPRGAMINASVKTLCKNQMVRDGRRARAALSHAVQHRAGKNPPTCTWPATCLTLYART